MFAPDIPQMHVVDHVRGKPADGARGVLAQTEAGRHAPQRVFALSESGPLAPNYLRMRLSPTVSIALGARTKNAGDRMVGRPVELYVCNDHPDEMSAYERLLGDAMDGEAMLFARQDAVEAAWRVVEPVLGVVSAPALNRRWWATSSLTVSSQAWFSAYTTVPASSL